MRPKTKKAISEQTPQISILDLWLSPSHRSSRGSLFSAFNIAIKLFARVPARWIICVLPVVQFGRSSGQINVKRETMNVDLKSRKNLEVFDISKWKINPKTWKWCRVRSLSLLSSSLSLYSTHVLATLTFVSVFTHAVSINSIFFRSGSLSHCRSTNVTWIVFFWRFL